MTHKRIILAATALATLAASCTDNFEEYNTNPYAIYNAEPSTLIPNMIEALMYTQQNSSQHTDQMVGSLGGYFTCSNRWGGQNFDTFNAPENWNAVPWNDSYSHLINIFDIEASTGRQGHFWAMAQLLKAAVLMRVADCYGPIPYSSIADRSFHTAYDSGEEVYRNIIADLRHSADILNQYVAANPQSRPLADIDLVYSGDYALWARLAASLALRAAVRVGDREAAEQICSAGGLIEENSQNAAIRTGGQRNPYQLSASSWGDLRANSSIVDYMVGYADPRTAEYFTTSTFGGRTGEYIGMPIGEAGFDKSDVAGYSLPYFEEQEPLPIFVAAETSFLKAECALRGWGVNGTAQSHYEQGIRLSMAQHGVGASQTESYIADYDRTPASHANDPRGNNYTRTTTVKIAWGADSDSQNLERVITQKWIANWPMGLEAWAEWRRTGFPELQPTKDNLNRQVITNTARGLRRLRYPYSERDLNGANYARAVQGLGGADNEATDLFWAKRDN